MMMSEMSAVASAYRAVTLAYTVAPDDAPADGLVQPAASVGPFTVVTAY
jgi:hypothetical protein